jgi:hypothetical protein
MLRERVWSTRLYLGETKRPNITCLRVTVDSLGLTSRKESPEVKTI